jgi:hypothetical protein
VDRLFGNSSTPSQGGAVKTEQNIQKALNSAIEKTAKGYLKAASNPRTSDETILAWLSAQRRVRAMAGDGIALPEGAVFERKFSALWGSDFTDLTS